MAVVKRLTQWAPRPGVERNEAIRRWRTSHVSLVSQVPRHAIRAERLHSGPDGTDPPYAGLGELLFETLEDAHAALGTAEWQAVIDDGGSRISTT